MACRADVEQEVVEADGAHQHRKVHRPGVGGGGRINRFLAQGHRPSHLAVVEERPRPALRCVVHGGSGRGRYPGPWRSSCAYCSAERRADCESPSCRAIPTASSSRVGISSGVADPRQLDLPQDGGQRRIGVEVGPLLGPNTGDVRSGQGIEVDLRDDPQEVLGHGQAHVERHPDRRQGERDSIGGGRGHVGGCLPRPCGHCVVLRRARPGAPRRRSRLRWRHRR